MRTRSILAVTAALALSAGAVQAQEAMSTAGATGLAPSEIDIAAAEPVAAAAPPAEQLDTAQQIQRWLAESPAAASEEAFAEGVRLPRDRQIHGEVGIAVGTGGYRSGYITSVMPLGENGTLALTLGQEKNGYRQYWGGRSPYGQFPYDPAFPY
ncbi:hypothetical protein [Phenylobacterium sp.]|uniref:hypothetical protein n=1 Tax=Phenylobacterium sp. TaxID=1871053 RepID=UPI0028A1D209|nr:hypothetical protein [Phenylobacterium sp.]